VDNKVKTQQQQQNKQLSKKPCVRRNLIPGPLAPKEDALPQSQLRETIVVKLFNFFDAMGRNVNQQIIM